MGWIVNSYLWHRPEIESIVEGGAPALSTPFVQYNLLATTSVVVAKERLISKLCLQQGGGST
jgi:hypothetical protein